jgi:hypothetical protein
MTNQDFNEQGEVENAEFIEDANEVDENGDTAEDRELATAQGWKPKSEYKGPAGRWRPAKEFLARGENELPLLRDNIRRLTRANADMTREMASIRDQNTQMGQVITDLRDLSVRNEQSAYARLKAEIQGRMDAAAEVSDMPAYRRAQQEMEALEPPPAPRSVDPAPGNQNRRDDNNPPPPPPAQRQEDQPVDPEVQQWMDENRWFNTPPGNPLASYALEQHALILTQHADYTMVQNLREVKRRVVAKFPERFKGTKPRAAAAQPPSGGHNAPDLNAKTYENMPKDAKEACDRLVKQIKGYTREEYVAEYYGLPFERKK